MQNKFDEETHKYLSDDVRVVSVTQAIGESVPFIIFNQELIERAALFGKAVHKTLEMLDLEINTSYDPKLKPYVLGWDLFKRDYINNLNGILIVDIKTVVFSPTWYLQLAGYYYLAKQAGLLKWEETYKQSVLVEEKIYTPEYAGMVDRIWRGGTSNKIETVAVQLREDGDYKIYTSPETLKTDFNTFRSMVNIWKWKSENKQLKENFKNEYAD